VAAVHHARLWQFVVALAEALQANRETDAFFGRLEDDEGRGLAGAQLLEQIVIDDHLREGSTMSSRRGERFARVGIDAIIELIIKGGACAIVVTSLMASAST